MNQTPVTLPGPARPTPLSPPEQDRAVANFVPYVAQALAERGRFQVTADTLEMIGLFQRVADAVGGALQRRVVCFANGAEVVITFDPQSTR